MIAWIGLGALILAAVWLAMVIHVATQLVHPPRRESEYWRKRLSAVTPAESGGTYEDVILLTRDRLRLHAWFLPSPRQAANGTLVFLHGVGGSRVSTIAGVVMFQAQGYNVLTYDSRGNGESEGDCCTYGFFEKDDLRCAIDYLATRADVDATRVAVLGKSMGAAIALQAAAIEPRIRCVIAEASFAELATIVQDFQRRRFGWLTDLLDRAAMRLAEKMAGFRVTEVSPLKAVRQSSTPVMFIHGADDPLVDAQNAKLLYDNARGPKELWIIPGGGHTELRTLTGDEYDQRRLEFLTRYLA